MSNSDHVMTNKELASYLRHTARKLERKHELGIHLRPGNDQLYSCNELINYGHANGLPYDARREARQRYSALFKPDSCNPEGNAWASIGAGIAPDGTSRIDYTRSWSNDDRVVALCLAAAIIEAGDEP